MDMPLKTMSTPFWLAAKRTAQDAADKSGCKSRNILSAFSGTDAMVPPLTGSYKKSTGRLTNSILQSDNVGFMHSDLQ